MKLFLGFIAGVIFTLLIVGAAGIRYKPIVLSLASKSSRIDVLHIYDRLTGIDIAQYPAIINKDNPLGILP